MGFNCCTKAAIASATSSIPGFAFFFPGNRALNCAPYIKRTSNNTGTVYVVSGSAGALGGHKETYPHNAMFYSNHEIGGAVMLEVQGNRLDLKWICSDGEIRDHFTMMKDVERDEEKLLKRDKVLSP